MVGFTREAPRMFFRMLPLRASPPLGFCAANLRRVFQIRNFFAVFLKKRCGFADFFCRFQKNTYLCGRVSPTRPAPPELRQVLIEAAVGGRSGAM